MDDPHSRYFFTKTEPMLLPQQQTNKQIEWIADCRNTHEYNILGTGMRGKNIETNAPNNDSVYYCIAGFLN